MKSPLKTVAIVAAVLALIAAMVVMNKMMGDDGVSGVKTGVEHDHDGDGQPDH